ncbi:MAG: Eco29kI family restriction endonuclease [Saprospiraceae bacterium]
MSNKNDLPYNPLDKINLGRSVANALLATPLRELPPAGFQGAGIYAIYYYGDHPAYEYVARYNNDGGADGEWPIYIGKAVKEGSRKGLMSVKNTGSSLFKRLSKHAKSIAATDNLKLASFKCRYLTIDSIWIPLGEQLLIHKFEPVWNQYIDGFGNNDPGMGRRNSRTSPWDILHPGRGYANASTGNILLNDRNKYVNAVLEKQRITYGKLINEGGDLLK